MEALNKMTKKWHGGKGSEKRKSDDQEAYADGWERIFGKKKPETKVRKTTPAHAKTNVHKDKTKYDRKRDV
tara:strand:+ start:331 stop:543 length:213 start_codon:yes stop_codon:yes gene_type:complete